MWKKAKIEETKLKLTYTKIYAPQAGKIGKKNVSKGSMCRQAHYREWYDLLVVAILKNQLKKLYPGKEVDIEIDLSRPGK